MQTNENTIDHIGGEAGISRKDDLFIKEIKKWFEANYLDGDEIQDGQMISSKECFSALLAQRQDIIKRIEEVEKREFEQWSTKHSEFLRVSDSTKRNILTAVKETLSA